MPDLSGLYIPVFQQVIEPLPEFGPDSPGMGIKKPPPKERFFMKKRLV